MIQNLAPLHLADLRKSGLKEETILEHRIESVRPCDIPRLIGFNLPGLESIYRIPFPPFNDGFERFKLFCHEGYECNDDGKKRPKYIQKRGSSNRLYIPLPMFPLLADTEKILFITEGEKKALAAVQAGLPCVAITGLWNWKRPGVGLDELIEDFDKITLRGRNVRLVPDNDWRDLDRNGTPKNLEKAVSRLARCLMLRGAKVEIVILPEGGSNHE